jgi:cystathionine beta-lyase
LSDRFCQPFLVKGDSRIALTKTNNREKNRAIPESLYFFLSCRKLASVMNYNFDKIIKRANTDSVKYDLREDYFGRKDVIPLWVADMDFETPPCVMDALKQRLEHSVMGYSIRTQEYYASIRNWLSKQYGWQVQQEEISFSPGVVPGLMMATYAFSEVGDALMVQPPVYFPFYSTIRDNKRKLLYNPLLEEDLYYRMDFADMERQFKQGVKAIMLSNPHNPVGRVWTRDELEQLLALCERYDVLIFSDEIHADLVFAPQKHIPMATLSPEAAARTITFMAASKTFNVAGLSTSFVVIRNAELMKKYQAIMEAMHLFSGNIMGTVATRAAFDCGNEWRLQMLDYVLENILLTKEFLHEHLPRIRFRVPEATFLLWLDFRDLGIPQKQLADWLIHRAGVGMNDGTVFSPGGAGFMRMNVATSRKILEQALNQIREAFPPQPNR